ncbi:MAG: DUF1571 domain-containing protein [Opitutaceae bacterium]|nr:DUF1571 domain-containing protein [Cytophagales bacterium]
MKYNKRTYLVLIFTIFSFLCFSQNRKDLSAPEIVKLMIGKTMEIKSMTFTMSKKERIKGTYPLQVSDIKLNVNPFKIYFRQKSPKDGLEVLYVQGSNSNKALVNTNGFPWVNIHLDPMGGTMRNNQHHTIFQSGYAHLMSILNHLTDKYKSNIDNIIKIAGTTKWDGRQCYIVVFENPAFKYINYKVQKGETILTIADKFKLSEHMIVELNNLSSFEISAERTILIPNDYAPKLELLIDKTDFIPLVMKVFDDKGLYEYYEYTNVKINPILTDIDFNQDNPGYEF